MEDKRHDLIEVWRSDKQNYCLGVLCLGITLFFWTSAIVLPFVMIALGVSGHSRIVILSIMAWLFLLSFETSKYPMCRQFYMNISALHKSVTIYREGPEIRHKSVIVMQQSLLMRALYRFGIVRQYQMDSTENDTNESSVFYPIHPHGIFSFGMATLLTFPGFKDVRFCVSSLLFSLPLFKSFMQLIAYIGPVEKHYIKRCLERRESLAIITGGFEEATIHEYGRDKVYLSDRKGFLTYCLRYGCKLRPVFVFGECNTFRNFPWLENLRLFMNTLGLPGSYPIGRMGTWIPYRSDINIVFGDYINMEQTDFDSSTVDKYHKSYVDLIKDIHSRYGPIFYGDSYRELEVY